jgi:hypothetical protein
LICPYCGIGFKPSWSTAKEVAGEESRLLSLLWANCSECERLVIHGQWSAKVTADRSVNLGDQFRIYPADASARRLAPEVTGEFAQDFTEAASVLNLSPKASAALSRRLLQHVIREKAGIKKANLDKEIDALIDSNQLPTDLAHDLDMIRHLGNFAAHPIKSTDTGQVVEVEAGEADALLDLLEELLDFYFVRPALREKKRATLNAKLAAAKKPPLKGTPDDDSPVAATLEHG